MLLSAMAEGQFHRTGGVNSKICISNVFLEDGDIPDPKIKLTNCSLKSSCLKSKRKAHETDGLLEPSLRSTTLSTQLGRDKVSP